MRDSHVDVVHHHAQLVRRAAMRLPILGRTQQNKILDLIAGHFARTKDRILKMSDRAERNAKANRRILHAQSRLAFTARAASDPARALLFFRVLCFLNRITARIFLRRAIAKIGRARCGQLQRRFTVQIQALRLKVRSFVPVDTQPSQAVQDALHQFRAIAFDVRILDAQHHGAAPAACK